MNFSGRTVISPNPNLPLYGVGVPLQVASILTYPERVTKHNRTRMQELVNSGPKCYPGALTVRTSDGSVRDLERFSVRRMVAAALQIGDVVDRHLQDGDIVLFNRQPSLHKMSIMCHRAFVLPGRTFRFNECVCTPYNADFDGDEVRVWGRDWPLFVVCTSTPHTPLLNPPQMNLHVPQTEEARAEAGMLMDVRDNMITPRSGEPLVAATQDFLTAAYLLTQRDCFLRREEFFQCVTYMSDASEEVDIPAPTILKPIPLWTGKQLFSLLLRPNRRIQLHTTFETKARNFSHDTYKCPDDGWVVFRNGELLLGNLCKATLGGGSKKGLVYALCRDEVPSIAARALLR